MGWKIGGMDIDGLKAAQLASMFANNAQIYAASNPGQATAAAGLQDTAQGSIAAFAAEKAAKEAEKKRKKAALGSAFKSIPGIVPGIIGGAIEDGGIGALTGGLQSIGNMTSGLANAAMPGLGSALGGGAGAGASAGAGTPMLNAASPPQSSGINSAGIPSAMGFTPAKPFLQVESSAASSFAKPQGRFAAFAGRVGQQAFPGAANAIGSVSGNLYQDADGVWKRRP